MTTAATTITTATTETSASVESETTSPNPSTTTTEDSTTTTLNQSQPGDLNPATSSSPDTQGSSPSLRDQESSAEQESMDMETKTGPEWIESDLKDTGTALLPQVDALIGPSTKTGYVYDVRMRFHNNVHGDDDHPEDPRRIWRIYDALNTGHCTERMVKVTSREATVEELSLVHEADHIENITKTTVMNKDELLKMANSYNSIYLNNSSAFCARLSCGSLIELCKAVALGEVLNGVAIIRPPGHHAEPHEAGGFCLYNNVAIAARDVHHGNGTQTAFFDDPDVVYCSIHRFDNGTFYPGDRIAAAHTAVGEGEGRGRTINIPWNSSGMGDSEYIYAFNEVIMPILYEFAPEFILVSAGFDAAKGDHIGQMLVTPAAYGHMTHMLKSLAGGKIILALEGGYNLDSIAVSGLACAKALLNDPIEPLGPIVPNAMCVQTIHEVIEVQSRYWKSLPQLYTDPVQDRLEGAHITELSKVLSAYREKCLWDKYGMIKMPKLQNEEGVEFLENVYCTQQTYNAKPVYIFVHDADEFCVQTLGMSNTIRTDKSVLNDTSMPYIDHIIKSGNELIDVVVPYQPTSETEKVTLKDKMSELLAEIWDNHVSTTGYLGRRIVLLAAGFGCFGLVSFMNERQKEVAKYVSCVTLVTSGEEPPPMVIKKLGSWYLENSFVIVPTDHALWERSQKQNNRIGNVVRSERPIERIADTMRHMRKSIFEDIESKLDSLPPVPDLSPDMDVVIADASNAMDTDEGRSAPSSSMDTESSSSPNNTNGSAASAIDGTSKREEYQQQVQQRHQLQQQLQHQHQKQAQQIHQEQQQQLLKLQQQQHQQQIPPSQAPPQPLSASSSPIIKNGTLPRQLPSGPSSRPGSPLMNGTSASRPIAQPFVDRPSVVGQQHRSQPYPAPNGRPAGSQAMSTTSPGSLSPMYAKNGAPPSRVPDPKQHPQYQDDPRYMDQYPPQHPRHQSTRQESYQYQAGDARPGPPTSRSSGPSEYYPPHSGTNSATMSPSGKVSPYQYPPNGSPHPPHSTIVKPPSKPPQQQPPQPSQQHYQQYPHSHPQQQQHQQHAFSGPPQGNGSGGNPRSGPPPHTTSGPPSYEPVHPSHAHRGSYSSQGPPPPPSSAAGHGPQQHLQQHPHGHGQGPANMNARHPGTWSQQQPPSQSQPPSQQQQQQMMASGRNKRAELEHDPYAGQYPPSTHTRQQQHQEMERERQQWADRQRWEMDQQVWVGHLLSSSRIITERVERSLEDVWL
ncbi:Histone deacetylase hda1 [Haplosporangium sp. Z 11]|nr:Histone deacetylase hda1 [Haplosporangium sp. Z 11]